MNYFLSHLLIKLQERCKVDWINTRKKSCCFALAWNFSLICAKILRKHAKAVNLTQNFTIIDQDDQQRLIKNICKSKNIDIKKISPNFILALINKWKNFGWYPNKVQIFEGKF